jgi:acyl-CoA synthetase (AMP-forming)/AMP-acid ligase II
VGRIKDIIIRGGENLFPVQIENALCDDQRILEAAVVAVPDAKYGEVVGAWIVRKDQSISREEVKKVVADRMNPQVRHEIHIDASVILNQWEECPNLGMVHR